MVEHLSSPVAQCLSLTLLHFLWQGLLLGLVYWTLLATTGVRSARVRYATSLLTLTLMALCPAVTFAVLYESTAEIDVTPRVAYVLPSSLSEVTPSAAVTHEITPTGDGATHLPRFLTASADELIRDRTVSVLQSAAETSQPYVLLLWLAGVLLSGARLTAGFLNVIWLRSGRIAVSTELADRSLTLARRLKLKTARVFASERIREAAVVGFWKPVVLLPASWLTELPPDVLEAVIAHELAHIRRFDVWVNLLQRILETLLFYHPMVWWLSNRIRQERELCCDELAVFATGNRGDYAIALEHVGRLQLQGTLRLAATFTGDGKMKLLSRIQHVLGTTRTPDREPSWVVGIVAVTASLAIAGAVGGIAVPNTAVAQEREGGRSAEAEVGPRRSAEAEAGSRRSPEAEAGPRRSAEAEAGPRRSAEADATPRRSAEAEERRRSREAEAAGRRSDERDSPRGLDGFRPQTEREEVLLRMIMQLRRELAELRREVETRSRSDRARDDDREERSPRRTVARVGDEPALPARWQNTKEGRVFKAYDKNGDLSVSLEEWLAMTNGNVSDARRAIQTKRYNEAEPNGDGKFTPAEFIYWYSKGRFANTTEGRSRGARDGEGSSSRRRDGEGEARGPRDGEGPPKSGPRDGDAPAKRGPRDGDAPAERGPRDGE